MNRIAIRIFGRHGDFQRITFANAIGVSREEDRRFIGFNYIHRARRNRGKEGYTSIRTSHEE